MTKLQLDLVTNSDNVSKINENFRRLETELQTRILYRNNPVGEPNTVETDIDINSKKLFNISEVRTTALVLNGIGVVPSEVAIATPEREGHATQFLQTDGESLSWQTVPAIFVSTLPAGTLIATNVQDALDELDTEKAIAANFIFVDNTSDINKPVSTLQQTALDLKVDLSTVGIVGGIVPLDGTGQISSEFLPSYVDDVEEYASLSSFPVTGQSGKIYVALDTNKVYRWSGTVYIYITSGAVDSVAGKTGLVTLVKTDVGLGSVDNTSDASKPVSTAQQTALNLKADIASLGTMSIQDSNAVVIKPQAIITPVSLGDMVFELTNNTTLVIKVRGSDNIVRSAIITID